MVADEMTFEAQTGRGSRSHLSGLAAASVVLGLLSLGLVPGEDLLLGLLILCPAGAVALGLWARRAIRASEGRLAGMPLTLTGIALGTVGAGSTTVGILLAHSVYRQVTPVAERFFTLANQAQWHETYDLFSPDYRKQRSLDRHVDIVRGEFTPGEEYRGLRWGYGLWPPATDLPGSSYRVWYYVRFSGGTKLVEFTFVRTATGWYILRLGPPRK